MLVMPVITWMRPCRRCGEEYRTWEVVSDKKDEETFGWTGDTTGLCPTCREKEEKKEDPQ